MHGERERDHALHVDPEAQNRSGSVDNADRQESKPAGDQTGTAPNPDLSDSEQAQANLERMLESGEENPIS